MVVLNRGKIPSKTANLSLDWQVIGRRSGAIVKNLPGKIRNPTLFARTERSLAVSKITIETPSHSDVCSDPKINRYANEYIDLFIGVYNKLPYKMCELIQRVYFSPDQEYWDV